jgi:hypothetical protein
MYREGVTRIVISIDVDVRDGKEVTDHVRVATATCLSQGCFSKLQSDTG